MRKTCFLDFKTWDDDQRFFFTDVATTLPRIARCEDLPKSFDLEKMFNRLSDKFKIDIKGKNPVTLDMDTMPKIIATSNYYLKGTGTAYTRRYKEYEITDWWRGKDPEKHYGHLLYFDWNEDEWSRFDSFMARCVGKYLKEGIKEYRGDNSAEKSLDTNLGDLRDFFDETLDQFPYWTTAMELIEKYENWYKVVHAGKFMKISYTAKTIKSKLKTYCSLKGLVYDDNDGAPRKRNGETKRWIQVTNSVTKVTNSVTESDDKDTVSVTYSADDPLFGDFAEKTEKGDGNSVTVTDLSPISSPIQTTENEGLVKKGDKVTQKTHSYIRKENENNNIGSWKVTSPFVTEKRIKTHKVDENGNIILED